MIKKIKITGAVLGIAASVFLLTFTALAWTGPSQAPPGGNLPPVLNQSTDSQYKEGALGIGGVFETDIDTHLGINGGNVGIGTTNPNTALEISGETTFHGNLNIDNLDKISMGYSGDIWLDEGNTNLDALLLNYTQGTNWTRVKIGDSSTSEKFAVYTASDTADKYGSTGWSRLFNIDTGGSVNVTGNVGIQGGYGIDWEDDPWGGSGDNAWIKYIQDGADENTELQIGIANDDEDNIAFYQYGSEIVTIHGGNVGINTTSPNAKLHVNSNTNIFGSFQQILHFRADPGIHKRYIHIKPPHQVTDGSIMRNFLIEGYAYGPNEVISSRIVYYIYKDGLTSTQGVDLAGNAHNPSVYVGSDNYVYLRLDVGDTYYNSFSLFGIEAANGGGYSTSGWQVTKSDSSTL